MARHVFATAVLLLLTTSGAARAAVPGNITNAQVETRTATQPFARELAALPTRSGPFWVGYRSASVGGPAHICADRGLRNSRLYLEAPAEFSVLARVEGRTVVGLQLATDDCDVDGGGLPLIWFDGVAADSGVAWLGSLIASPATEQRLAERALMALVWHPAPQALQTVIDAARRDRRTHVRSQALFWLSQRAGREAVAAIASGIDDPEVEVKKKAVFALSQLPANEGVPLLINAARTHASRDVRRQAMFWLGQSKDPRAVAFFEEVLRR